MMKDMMMLGHGSGNYFKSGKYKFILTAAHVINHPFETYMVDGEELIKLRPIHIDPSRDLAVLVPEKELENIDAKTFRVNGSTILPLVRIWLSPTFPITVMIIFASASCFVSRYDSTL